MPSPPPALSLKNVTLVSVTLPTERPPDPACCPVRVRGLAQIDLVPSGIQSSRITTGDWEPSGNRNSSAGQVLPASLRQGTAGRRGRARSSWPPAQSLSPKCAAASSGGQLVIALSHASDFACNEPDGNPFQDSNVRFDPPAHRLTRPPKTKMRPTPPLAVIRKAMANSIRSLPTNPRTWP